MSRTRVRRGVARALLIAAFLPAGLAGDGTLLPDWLKLGVQARGRFEAPSGVGLTSGSSDRVYLNRLRFDLGIRPAKWLRFAAQAQDSRAVDYSLGIAPPSMHDPLDLRQAYLELGGCEGCKVQLKAGRQELHLGSGRLVASPEWGNTGKTFDAVRMTLSRGRLKADLVAASPVAGDSARCNRRKPGEYLFGGYVTMNKLLPVNIEPYGFARTQAHAAGERGDTGRSHLYTGGARLFGKLAGGFDYSAELMRQWGYVASDRVAATAGAYSLGWTVARHRWKPRASFDINHASGDRAVKDGARNTFDSLYSSLHSYYGISDQSGQRNIRQYKYGLEATPSAKWKASVDFRELCLATVQDGFYNSAGMRVVLNRNAASRHVGAELDIQGTYLLPGGVALGVGFARVFAGAYLKESGRSGYSYPYVMWSKRL